MYLVVERYRHPKLWPLLMDEDQKFRFWLEVEIAVARVQGGLKLIPPQTADALQKILETGLSGEEIRAEEAVTRHDLQAFLNIVRREMNANGAGEFAPFVHYGLTSYDVEDTASAIIFQKVVTILEEDLQALVAVLKRLAGEHWRTLQIGRTHGMHAEVITFGYKLAVWLDKVINLIHELKHLAEVVSVGKISGAVGTYTLDPEIEARVCGRLHLLPAKMSTQILDRRIHAQFAMTLVIIAQVMGGFTEEIRNLQRPEIAEVQEAFARGQVGSSAMKHKRNPIRSENVSSLAKLVRGMVEPFLANIITWHERDLSNSAAERLAIPQLANLVGFMIQRTTGVLDGLLVDKERMLQNLNSSCGVVYSQNVLLQLRAAGMAPEEAESLVQELTFKAMAEGVDFRHILTDDRRVTKVLTAGEIYACFNPWLKLRYIDQKAALLGIEIVEPL